MCLFVGVSVVSLCMYIFPYIFRLTSPNLTTALRYQQDIIRHHPDRAVFYVPQVLCQKPLVTSGEWYGNRWYLSLS